MGRCTLLQLGALFLMVAKTMGGELLKDDECPLNGISVPECPINDPEFSVFFPHPSDCHWFFHCSNGVAYCKKCPAGLEWNTVLDTCDYPYNAGCSVGGSTPPSSPDVGTTTSTPVVTIAPIDCPAGVVPTCPFPDPAYSVFFPHPNDCHYFFHCSNGVAYCKKCPADLHWNTVLDTCDYPYRAGCDGKIRLLLPRQIN